MKVTLYIGAVEDRAIEVAGRREALNVIDGMFASAESQGVEWGADMPDADGSIKGSQDTIEWEIVVYPWEG